MKKHDHLHLDSTTLKYRLEKGILSELLPYRQWIVWRYQLVNDQWKKQPFNPLNGRAAKTNDRSTWGTFSQALYRLETGEYHGIGFVFSDEDPFTGTDLDGAVNDDDTARTDRLYRRSGLFVEKWDRPLGEYPYAQVTIHNALKKRSMRSS